MNDRNPESRALLIAGMHRSGTSLLALFLGRMGVHIGDGLLAGDPGNPTGYGEDTEILEIQRRLVMEACAPHDTGGWPDWGWTPAESFSPPERTERELLGYAERRGQALGTGQPAWGWKEPRTTLLLEAWENVLPDAARVFVYRHPRGVQGSMERLGFPPEVAVAAPDIWCFYNEAILSALDRHPQRSVLVESSAVASAPEVLVRAVEGVLGVALDGDPAAVSRSLVDPDRVGRLGGPTSPIDTPKLSERAQRVLDALEARAIWRP